MTHGPQNYFNKIQNFPSEYIDIPGSNQTIPYGVGQDSAIIAQPELILLRVANFAHFNFTFWCLLNNYKKNKTLRVYDFKSH